MPEFKDFFKSKYTGAWTVPDGKDLVLTIDRVALENVVGEGGRNETLPVCRFREAGVLPLVLNRTNFKTIVKLTGKKDSDQWSGQCVQLFKSTTKLKGDVVECVRIRPTAPKLPAHQQQDKPVNCEDCGAVVSAVEVAGKKYSPATVLSRSNEKYQKNLCFACLSKRNEEAANESHEA